MARSQSLQLVEDKGTGTAHYRRLVGELWPSELRQGHSLHYVVNYDLSFRPELPNFCIRRYSGAGDVVLDPFCGRGTTVFEAGLLGRIGWGSDINPLAIRSTLAKCLPAGLDEVVLRLNEIHFERPVDLTDYQNSLFPFYHPDTYRELVNLKRFLEKNNDRVARFIELLALSRLHGHTPSYFSAYSAPQIALHPERQLQLNLRRRENPDYRAVAPRLIKRAAQVLQDGFSAEFFALAKKGRIESADARRLSYVNSNSVDLIVTSPPSPVAIDYMKAHWLSYWFMGANAPRGFGGGMAAGAHSSFSSLTAWSEFMTESLSEMLRALKPGSYAVLALGECQLEGRKVLLDECVAAVCSSVSSKGKRFNVEEVLIHQQRIQERAGGIAGEQSDVVSQPNRLLVLRCSERANAPGRGSLHERSAQNGKSVQVTKPSLSVRPGGKNVRESS